MDKKDLSITLNRILERNPAANDELEKLVQFFRLVVELEQAKEPQIDDSFQFPYAVTAGTLSVKAATNKDFIEKIEDNADVCKTKWPKDLCVTLEVAWEDEIYPLFQYVMPYDVLKEYDIVKQDIECSIRDFTVNLKTANELELGEEKIVLLEGALKDSEDSLKKVEEQVMACLNDNAALRKVVRLSLSEKNPSLLQIYSELRKIDAGVLATNTLVGAFLKQGAFQNRMGEIDKDKLIRVTELDESQATAVAEALSHKVSVVTGPPGCGKTQVILNLMANALVSGKKVLVASKNNKAVDNVKDRFDKFETLKSCIRFASKQKMREGTLPEIERLLGVCMFHANNGAAQAGLADVMGRYDVACKRIDEGRKLIAQRSQLKADRKDAEGKVSELQEANVELQKKYAEEKNRLRESNIDLLIFEERSAGNLEELLVEARQNRNAFQARYSGLGKLWINWFTKGRHAAALLEIVDRYRERVANLIRKRNGDYSVAAFRSGRMISDFYQGIVDTFEAAKRLFAELEELKVKFRQSYQRNKDLISEAKAKIDQIDVELGAISRADPDRMLEDAKTELGSIGPEYVNAACLANLTQDGAAAKITNYKNYLPDNIPWRREELSIFSNRTRCFLDVFKLSSVTSLSAKAAFPLDGDLFDMVIIDEASQCDIASAIPLFLRAKQWVVIGDPMQLKHISKVNAEEERGIKHHLGLTDRAYLRYAECSLWDYCRDWLLKSGGNDKPIMLDRHYRCHPDIIGFSNEHFYSSLADGGLKVCTSGLLKEIDPKGVFWVDVKGKQVRDSLNLNLQEVDAAMKLTVELASAYPKASIGIVTPFKSQAMKLNERIPDELRDRVIADTVHKFQGDERDVMIYSLVVTNNSPASKIRWIDYAVPNLVNVAVTRARSALYIIGNKDYIQKASAASCPLGHLLEYAERVNGTIRNLEREALAVISEEDVNG